MGQANSLLNVVNSNSHHNQGSAAYTRIKQISQRIQSPVTSKHPSGFTIVELLIVIVVIAILAALSYVGYTSINNRAAISVLQSDLSQAAKQLDLAKAESGTYQGTDGTTTDGSPLMKSDGTTLQYTRSNSGQSFCITATTTKANVPAYTISSDNKTPREGTCSGHTGPSNGGSGGSEIAANTPIQNITQTQCQALPVFTGTNDTEAVKTVTDNRGGTTRTYRIAKLADNNCWMLDNLKLGSTTGTTTLTPSDSNVAANFTLPQVQAGGSASSDNPTVSGPVSGDTGSGATNYGYLYNWPAATAGETRTSITTGNAANSICAKGWRLPTGGNTGEFAMLNAKMNNPAATSPSNSGGTGYYQNWHYTGQFKGVFAGNWWMGFYDQGVWGALWSSSANPALSDRAFGASFNADGVYPGSSYGRSVGNGVRCLLQ